MGVTAPDQRANMHHGLATHEVVLLLETDPVGGLTEREAGARRERYGPNALSQEPGASPLIRLVRQLHNPLIYVLLAAGVVTLALGEHVDAVVIFGVVIINTIVGFIQESKAEAALEALRSMVHTEVRLIRDGRARTVPSEDLVPGDLVRIEAGDRVPADLRLIRVSELQADESALTGESVPVVKDEVALPEDTPVADRRNMVYSGTLVTSGTGAGITVATGSETELGEIHRLVGAAGVLDTPLTRKLTWFSKILTVVILALAAVTFVIGVARGESVTGMFTAAVALAVGAIPEGLPAAVTITLAIGVARMAHRGAVIRRLPAVETLGSTTVICSDKTGTLTENQMTVRAVHTPSGRFQVTGAGYAAAGEILDHAGRVAGLAADDALRWCVLAGAACNDSSLSHHDDVPAVVGDPTEGAMLVLASKAGLDQGGEVATAFPRVATIPFSSQRRYMATLHTWNGHGPAGAGRPGNTAAGEIAAGGAGSGRAGAGGAGSGRAGVGEQGQARGGAVAAAVARRQFVVFAKGAAERIFGLCASEMAADGTIAPLDRDAAHRAAAGLAREGLRVLATAVLFIPSQQATGEFVPEFGEGTLPGAMVFTGLQAMLDPPRAAAVAAVRTCQTAGISVKMITGDHAATAAAVAGSLGILPERRDGEVLTGADLAALPAGEFADAVERAAVFARVSPEQKLRLVEAFQTHSEVVAMTGDGVNDAPALRRADIGVAMGRSGTEVAKDSADMVLTDDDFTTIESAVEEGRGVFANLTKFIVWTLPTNMGEGLVILAAILLGSALPILPTQILWINMTTAVALGLMLAFEPKEKGIMQQPPRDPRRPLLTGVLIWRIVLVSALLVGGAWWLFQWEQGNGATLAEARSAAVNLFVMVELFYLFSCRSLTRSMWQIGIFSNRWILGGVAVQVAGQLAITYLPVMNNLFQTAPIAPGAWLRILALALAAWLVVAIDKRLTRGAM